MTNSSIAKRFAVILGLAGALGLGACAGTATQKSTGEVMDDAAITAMVKTQFATDDEVDAMDIKVETYKGVVQLSGFADNQSQINRAVDIARRVDGVKEVQNDIQLKSSTSGALDDGRRTAAVALLAAG